MLVYNHHYQKSVLMVLDVYAVHGARYADHHMRQRIEAIRSARAACTVVP